MAGLKHSRASLVSLITDLPGAGFVLCRSSSNAKVANTKTNGHCGMGGKDKNKPTLPTERILHT